MRCRFCKQFQSVTLASGDFPKGKYKEERVCPFKGTVVHRDDPIFEKVKSPEDKTKTIRKYCEGFILVDTFYCEEKFYISVIGCIKRQDSDEESKCGRCKRKHKILEMRKISFLLQRKRDKAQQRFKPIVR